jgi:hypothetical protein
VYIYTIQQDFTSADCSVVSLLRDWVIISAFFLSMKGAVGYCTMMRLRSWKFHVEYYGLRGLAIGERLEARVVVFADHKAGDRRVRATPHSSSSSIGIKKTSVICFVVHFGGQLVRRELQFWCFLARSWQTTQARYSADKRFSLKNSCCRKNNIVS